MTGATQNIYCGLQEFEEMAFLLHFLRKDDLPLDIGANIGSYTILAASSVGARTMAIWLLSSFSLPLMLLWKISD